MISYVFGSKVLTRLVTLLAFCGAHVGYAQSHAMINDSRSSLSKNVFVSQGVEGESGRFKKFSGNADAEAVSQSWRGYGIRNGVGIELFKFTQFALSHSLLNLHAKESSLENLTGSRLSASIRLAFSSPIGNIEFGSGLLASQLEYQNLDRKATFLGSGHFYSLGWNYFLSPSISIFAHGQHSTITLTQSNGDAGLSRMESARDGLGLGLKIWL